MPGKLRKNGTKVKKTTTEKKKEGGRGAKKAGVEERVREKATKEIKEQLTARSHTLLTPNSRGVFPQGRIKSGPVKPLG